MSGHGVTGLLSPPSFPNRFDLADPLDSVVLVSEHRRETSFMRNSQREGDGAMRIECPHCRVAIDVVDETPDSDITCPSCLSRIDRALASTLKLSTEEMAKLTEQPATPAVPATDQSTAQVPDTPKKPLFGRYELQAVLGQGTFGTVWKALDTDDQRLVALKLLRSQVEIKPGEEEAARADRTRFEREARTLAKLDHPGIVRLYKFGVVGDRLYLASELIDGGNLKKLLENMRDDKQSLTFNQIAQLCGQVAEALHAAHQAGIVHRDLKPANIILDKTGLPHVADFGVAKRDDRAEYTLTQGQELLGTPNYMAPEQWVNAHQVGSASDIYSLGAMLYELLTGRVPFMGTTLDKLLLLRDQVLRDDPISPRKLRSDVPADLETICLKGLEKDPGRRFASANELSNELRRFVVGDPIEARPPTRLQLAWRWSQRNPMIATQLRVSTALHLAGESEHARHIYPVRSLLLAMHAVESTLAHNEPVLPSAEKNLRDALSLVTGLGIAVQDAAITCQSISPDGRWLVTGSTDTTARVWDLSASDPGATPRVLRGHEGGIKCLSISPNSRWLVTGSWDGTARVWDLLASDDGLSPRILRGHEEGILCLSISPDGRWLITGSGNPIFPVTRNRSKDNTARVWDLSAVDPSASSRILRGHENNIECLSISPNGRWLITGSRDKMARIWDLSAIDPVASSRALRGHEDSIECLAISPDSRWLITGSRDKTARIWDLSAVDPGASPRVLHGHDEGIGCVSISSDGHWLVTAAGYGFHAEDNAAKVWDLSASDPGASVRIFDPENGITCLGFSPDARWLVTGGNHAAVVWDLFADHLDLSRRVLTGFDGEVRCLTFSSDGHWLVMAGDTMSRICDLTARNATVTPCVFRADTLELGFLAMSPNQRWLVASGKLGNTAAMWDLSAADPVASRRLLDGHGAVAITPDSRWLAIGGGVAEFSVGLWDLSESNPSRSPDRVIRADNELINCMCISPDGRWLITGSEDNAARVWDLSATGPSASPLVLRGHDSAIECLAISSDGRWLVTGSADTTVRVWDLSAVNPNASVRVLSVHQRSVKHMSLSADGRWLVTSEIFGNTAIVWDLSASDPTANTCVLDGHQSSIECMLISPDGRWLVTGSWDKTARVWDLSADNPGASPRVLSGHDATINCLAISPDGRWLVTGCGHVVSSVTPSNDTSLRVWDLSMVEAGLPRILPGHGIATTCLALSSDGKWVVSGGEDEDVRVSDLSIHKLMNASRRVAGRTLTRDERMQHAVPDLLSESETKHVDDGELPILFPTMYTSLKTDASWHEQQITDVTNRQDLDMLILNGKQTTVADARQAWFMITFHRSRQMLLKPDDPVLWQQLQQDAKKTIAEGQPLPPVTVTLYQARNEPLPTKNAE